MSFLNFIKDKLAVGWSAVTSLMGKVLGFLAQPIKSMFKFVDPNGGKIGKTLNETNKDNIARKALKKKLHDNWVTIKKMYDDQGVADGSYVKIVLAAAHTSLDVKDDGTEPGDEATQGSHITLWALFLLSSPTLIVNITKPFTTGFWSSMNRGNIKERLGLNTSWGLVAYGAAAAVVAYVLWRAYKKWKASGDTSMFGESDYSTFTAIYNDPHILLLTENFNVINEAIDQIANLTIINEDGEVANDQDTLQAMSAKKRKALQAITSIVHKSETVVNIINKDASAPKVVKNFVKAPAKIANFAYNRIDDLEKNAISNSNNKASQGYNVAQAKQGKLAADSSFGQLK
jgi:hypothetical protein